MKSVALLLDIYLNNQLFLSVFARSSDCLLRESLQSQLMPSEYEYHQSGIPFNVIKSIVLALDTYLNNQISCFCLYWQDHKTEKTFELA